SRRPRTSMRMSPPRCSSCRTRRGAAGSGAPGERSRASATTSTASWTATARSMNRSPEGAPPDPPDPPPAALDPLHAERGAKRFVVLVEGSLGVLDAKTAVALLRYAPDSVAALLDSTRAGQTAERALGFGGAIPIVGRLDEALAFRPDALLVG